MSMTQNAYRIMNAMNGGAKANTSEFMSGTVVSVSPLSINVEGRMTIPADFIVLSPFCIKAEFENSIPTEESDVHVHEFHVGLWRGLQVGDKLVMATDGNGQQYHALYRINMIFGDMGTAI